MNITFKGYLQDDNLLFPEELKQATIFGSTLQVAFVHIEAKVLYLTSPVQFYTYETYWMNRAILWSQGFDPNQVSLPKTEIVTNFIFYLINMIRISSKAPTKI